MPTLHAIGTKVLIETGLKSTTERIAVISGYKPNKNGTLEPQFKSLTGYKMATINARIIKIL